MRVINTVGSSLFVAYGAVLWANGGNGWSLVICNTLLVCFNVYHIIKLALTLKKQKVDERTAADAEQTAVAQDDAAENADDTLLAKIKDLASSCENMDEFRAELDRLGTN